ncbi:MAG: hypothetical protein KC550_04735 [Nanoarchaeota archaeon]|nr:hypothetical protein [Nanoarchaeota archaeon]
MNKLKVSDFSLKHTLECGQFFLYELEKTAKDNFYYVLHKNIYFKIKQESNTLIYENIDEKDLINFFSLELDLNTLTSDFNDEYLLIALEKYWGMRLIRQDLWQCMIGFVCSSASNIPKIKNNLKLISNFFGEEKYLNGKKYHTFPKPGGINDLEKLKEAKTGYRAKFIFEINNIIIENPNLLNEIKKADYKTSKKLLIELPGIGSKVADCICLFALGHKEAFPIDTWVKQIIEKLYLKREAKNLKEIENYIEKNFDGHKGLKQQYLFYYMRNKKIIEK